VIGSILKRWLERRVRGVWSVIRVLLIAGFALVWLLAGEVPVHAQSQTPDGPVYVVQSGDTLSDIAARFGLSLNELLTANPMSDPNRIHPGDRLVIPGLEGVSGEIHALRLGVGESLQGLSWRYGTPVEALVRLNHLLSPEQLYVGVELLVPVQAEQGYAPFTLAAGETMLEAALVRGMNPWSLVLENDLPGTWAAVPGQPLMAPAEHAPESAIALPEPVRAVVLKPLPLVQGRTTVIEVQVSAPVTLTGSLAGYPLHFFPLDEEHYVALQGIPAMAEPGLVSLQIQGETADGRTWSLDQQAVLAAGGYGYESLHVDPMLVEESVSKAEMEFVRPLMSAATPHRYWVGRFLAPSPFADCFNSVFGTRRSYNDRPYNTYHSGLDFCGGTGVEIYAPAAGRVVFAGPLTVRGNATIIDHGWGVITGYWHQSEIRVQVGELVEPGQVIGLVGGTGRVTGAHLHWELWVGGVPVDPLDWLQQAYP